MAEGLQLATQPMSRRLTPSHSFSCRATPIHRGFHGGGPASSYLFAFGVIDMTRRAPHVYTHADDITRIETLAGQLPSNAHVTVTCKDGSSHTGVVGERPILQLFFDDRGGDDAEGMNAVVRLEDPAAPDGSRTLWLDDIVEVRKLDSISGQHEA
jgi:hypothetical protein